VTVVEPPAAPPLRVLRTSGWNTAPGGAITLEAHDPIGVILRVARALSVTAERSGPETTLVRGTVVDLKRLAGGLDAARAPAAAQLWHFLEPVRAWRVRGHELDVTRPLLMGILNLTGDSFSGDGVGGDAGAARRRANELRAAGAAIIDVGGESARADRPVREAEEEAEAVARAVEALTSEGHVLSVDTYKPPVARAAVVAGASIVNDISGLTLSLGAAAVAAQHGAGYVLNYSFSEPKKRPPAPPVYGDVVSETLGWMFSRVQRLESAGLARESIVIDPGIAFGKSHDEDLQVIRRIGEFTSLGLPLMLAHSRKNFLGSITGGQPHTRDLETHVVSALAYAQGARIFRVHDVEGARRALEVADAIVTQQAGAFAPNGETWPWRAGASATHMTRGEADKEAPPGQRW
jgi:dihydropteroate synthase